MVDLTLGDMGERRLLRELVVPLVDAGGDDCAVIGSAEGQILVSTDPVPEPAAMVLAGDDDPYWKGWLLVTINASDLAAGGAFPLGFVAALEAPASLSVDRFRRFLAGIKDACSRHGLRYVGGNVREGERVTGTGTVVGACKSWRPLSRGGASVGDIVVSVGQGGLFWRDGIRAMRLGERPADLMKSPLFAPIAQTGLMWRLAQRDLIRAAMDNSDGLLPTLAELATSSAVTIELDLANLLVPGDTGFTSEPSRLWLGWGDWNVIACVSPEALDSARSAGADFGTPVIPVGRCVRGQGEVMLRKGTGPCVAAPRLESERFAADSWFKTGISTYVAQLLSLPLP